MDELASEIKSNSLFEKEKLSLIFKWLNEMEQKGLNLFLLTLDKKVNPTFK